MNGISIRKIKIYFEFHLPDDEKIEEEIGQEIKKEIERKINELNYEHTKSKGGTNAGGQHDSVVNE